MTWTDGVFGKDNVIGTLRRELLDRSLILGELHRVVVSGEYLIHYNGHRSYQSWRQCQPIDLRLKMSFECSRDRMRHLHPKATGMGLGATAVKATPRTIIGKSHAVHAEA